MRIVYLHQYFKTPTMAGGTRSYEMALRLVRKGHQVHVVTSRTDLNGESDKWYVETIDGITVHWLPVAYSNSMGFARRLLAFSDFARKAGRYAAKIEADVVFATSTPLTIAVPGVKASRALNAPMVFEVRDLWPEIPIALGVLKSPFTKFMARMLEHWAYKNASQVIGLSPGMCAGVIRSGYPPARVHCIPNSADIDLFSVSDETGKDFRRLRPWLGGRPLVLYAGTLGRVNGVGYLVEMAKHALELNPDIRFLVVGEGIELAEIEENARKAGVLGRNFFMEPPVSKASMPALLNAATVTTSLVIDNRALWDNSANKFFDSLAAGRPIFVNHGGWQAELLHETGAGFEVPGNDPKRAAMLVAEFVGNPDGVTNAGLAARDLAEKRFDRNILAQKLESVLELAVRDAHV